jgi:hypothetical protein
MVRSLFREKRTLSKRSVELVQGKISYWLFPIRMETTCEVFITHPSHFPFVLSLEVSVMLEKMFSYIQEK